VDILQARFITSRVVEGSEWMLLVIFKGDVRSERAPFDIHDPFPKV